MTNIGIEKEWIKGLIARPKEVLLLERKFEIRFYSGDSLLGTQTLRSDDYNKVYETAQGQL